MSDDAGHQMLARAEPVDAIALLARLLRMPEKSAELVQAEQAVKTARANLEVGQANREWARRVSRMGGGVSLAQIQEHDDKHTELMAVVAAAEAERARLLGDWQSQVAALAEAPLAEYQAMLEVALDHLVAVLEVGSGAHADAVLVGIRLPNRVAPAAAILLGKAQAMRALLRSQLRAAAR
jgi:hypothetical protein